MSKQIIALAVLGVVFFAGPASAAKWTYNGVIDNCNVAVCSLVPIVDGDPVTGTLEIDVGPSDSFTLDTAGDGSGGLLDLIGFEFLVGGVIPVLPVECPDFVGDPPVPGVCDPVTGLPDGTGVILSGSGTTDANGDFASGTVTGLFVGATLGPLLGSVTIDLLAGTMSVSIGDGAVFVADVVAAPGFVQVIDTDGDGVADESDNCTLVANASQRDTDGDSIGNDCDADVSGPGGVQDCIVNFLDLLIYRANFFMPGDLDTDNNGDNFTNFLDLLVVRSQFFGSPGPSGLPNPCDPTD